MYRSLRNIDYDYKYVSKMRSIFKAVEWAYCVEWHIQKTIPFSISILQSTL